MAELSWASLSSPVGTVSVGCSEAGVARVRYGRPAEPASGERGSGSRGSDSAAAARFAEEVGGSGSDSAAAARFAEQARAELIEYFRGDRRAFDVPVDWSAAGGPQRRVLTVLAGTVGYGETISYGALARRSGLTADPAEVPAVSRPGDPPWLPARAVGTIMAANPIPLIVPCHRVLASDGLGGYSGGAGVEVKRWLLILEGSHPPTLDWDARGVPGAPGPDWPEPTAAGA